MSFAANINLSSLNGSNGFRLDGVSAGDESGYSVASAGDVNGDGFADMIIGAPYADPNGDRSGASFVVFGAASGFASSLKLSALNGSNGFRLAGASAGDVSGWSVASAGDVSGDGFADLIISAPDADPNGDGSGASYVVFGASGGFASSLNLSALSGSNGFRLEGVTADDFSGRSVASAGDVNGDGFADIIIGVPFADSIGSFRDASYVVFGASGGFASSLNLSALNGSNGFRLAGDVSFQRVSVASAGDVNGDGFADIIVGAPLAETNANNSGASYVVFGASGGFASSLNLSALNGSNGFRLVGVSAFDRSGYSVASAGDVNGDGFADIIVGAYQASPSARASGASYVVFGASGGFAASLNLSALNGSNGFRIDGVLAFDQSGNSVASAGDVNGDGFADIIIGALTAGPDDGAPGASYVVFGAAGGFAPSLKLSALNGSNGFRLTGVSDGDDSGQSVASAGDVNGDGRPDLIIGAPFASPNGRDSGASYVYLNPTTGPVLNSADTLRGTADNDALNGNAGNDRLYGNAGNDTINGGTGRDTLAGGEGDDTYVMDKPGDVIIENPGQGLQDTAWLTASGITAFANVEIWRLAGLATSFSGTAGNEQLVANQALASSIDGGAGDDVLWGSALNNTLAGGAGDDIFRGLTGGGTWSGGSGNDQFVVSNLATILIENPNEGTDTAWVTANGYTIGASVEITRLAGTASQVTGSGDHEQIVANPTLGSTLDGGAGDDVLWGSGFADSLVGGAGADIFRGQGEADTMLGGSGDDQFVVLNPGVVIVENAGEGYDTIWYATSGETMAANTERANLAGLANSVAGNAGDNLIVGNPTLDNAFLVGGAGNDTIFGGAGVDLFRGDAGDDVLVSGGGADVFAYQGPGFGYDQIAGFAQGQAKIDFRGSGIAFADLFLNSAGGNTQVEVFGSAILVFGVAQMSASDFLFG